MRFFEGIKSLRGTFKQTKGGLLFQSFVVNLIYDLNNYDGTISALRQALDDEGNVKDTASVLLKKIRTEYAETLKDLRQSIERYISHNQVIARIDLYDKRTIGMFFL